jgi:hypothetical protein
MTELLSLPELAAKLLNADLMPTSDTSVLHEVAHALILRCEALEAENADLKQRSAVVDQPGHPVYAPCAIEHCKYDELERENALLKRSLTLLEATLSERTRQLHGRED